MRHRRFSPSPARIDLCEAVTIKCGGKVKANKYAAIAAKVLVVVVLLAVVSGGCGGGSIKVETGRVSPREIAETVMVAGTLDSSNPTQVIPAVSGSVAQVSRLRAS